MIKFGEQNTAGTCGHAFDDEGTSDDDDEEEDLADECGRICDPAVHNPVCGSNNRTYENECYLQLDICNKVGGGGLSKRSDGVCESGTVEQACSRITIQILQYQCCLESR